MKLRVKVTAQDIDKGEPDYESQCPVALALERAGVLLPQVNHATIRGRWPRHDGVNGPEYDYFTVPTPAKVAAFVGSLDPMDRHGPPKPFTFDLELPVGKP